MQSKNFMIWRKKSKILMINKSYCLNNTESKNPSIVRTENGRLMLLSECAVCNSKKLKFIKEQEARGLLSSLGIKTPLSQISLLGPLLF